MKQWYSPWYIVYMLMLLAFLAMGNSIKHLMRLGAWESLGFVVFKDLVLALTVAYLFHLSRTSEETRLRSLALRSIWALLMVSSVGDYAVALLKA